MTTNAISPLRQRMIEDMNARKLSAGTQTGHVRSCRRFAAFLRRSPETAEPDDVRRFQLHLAEAGVSLCTRNRISPYALAAAGIPLAQLPPGHYPLAERAENQQMLSMPRFGQRNQNAKLDS